MLHRQHRMLYATPPRLVALCYIAKTGCFTVHRQLFHATPAEVFSTRCRQWNTNKMKTAEKKKRRREEEKKRKFAKKTGEPKQKHHTQRRKEMDKNAKRSGGKEKQRNKDRKIRANYRLLLNKITFLHAP